METGAGLGGVLPQLRLDDLLAELHARLEAVIATRDRMHGLFEAVIAIGSGLELETMLRRIVEAAVGLVDARYGALGVIGDDQGLTEFIPVGLDPDEIAAIHHWPEGRGLLGLLVKDPHSLRLADISAHKESSGFPEGHPQMRSFLGVPVRVRDRVFGNLYLTEKHGGGEFTEDDEAIVTALGAAAGVAIENARLYDEARRQQDWLRASGELTIQLLSGDRPSAVLEALTSQVLRLSGADLVTLALPDEDDGRRLTLEFAEGRGADHARGLVIPADNSLSGEVLASGEPLTVEDFATDDRTAAAARHPMGHIGPAVLFPLGAPGNVRGVLTMGRRSGSQPFSSRVTEMIQAFAGQAALALELAARRADAEQLSVFEDRDRIARDLHDLVIQRLYATGMSLQGTLPIATRPEVAERIRNAVDAMDDTIKDIRGTIFALQARRVVGTSLRAEILVLLDEMTTMLGFAPVLRLGSGLGAPVGGELSEHLLAVLREALSNVARHSGATQVSVTVDVAAGWLTALVSDNGCGVPEGTSRSGLRNMAGRAEKLGGEFRLSPAEGGGTDLEWRVPVPAGDGARDEAPPAAAPGRYPLR
jgi:signal transduction histidine kinase